MMPVVSASSWSGFCVAVKRIRRDHFPVVHIILRITASCCKAPAVTFDVHTNTELKYTRMWAEATKQLFFFLLSDSHQANCTSLLDFFFFIELKNGKQQWPAVTNCPPLLSSSLFIDLLQMVTGFSLQLVAGHQDAQYFVQLHNRKPNSVLLVTNVQLNRVQSTDFPLVSLCSPSHCSAVRKKFAECIPSMT